MSDTHIDALLIGGGVASTAAAVELRKQGFPGSIALVTRELEPPYHRPAITKELLGPAAEAAELLVLPREWWQDNNVELRTRSAVMSLDTGAHRAVLADKTTIHYEKALVATGAMVRRLSLPGSALTGIHYLRAPGNAHKLRAQAAEARTAVLVGGSFIAAEVAASLTAAGVRCTMVMQERAPLEIAFGTQVADHLARSLAERGVELICGEQVTEFTGEGAVDGVRTASGRHVPADLVVVGVGAVPDTKLAQKAGLRLGPSGGILCDSTLRTSAADHFAAGDVCEYHSEVHGRSLRVEHEDHAAAQGVTAARGILGSPEPHREVPYFWTELGDWARLEYVGPATEWDQERVTGSFDDGDFTVWYEHRGRVVAALTCGRPGDLDRARHAIAGI
ncbi:FAD-dependent oxidoreductase [Amycolatopsis rhabdoformis]|uniref:FAD-dependent oxidoreductase n=1 Tax=Amycolatopsis rhabdoformis TaxID=1448059 RepID=A0ABZ1ILS5_9PSEU|nr:FAD-dependent oxidoreductase [Amycolatopsis rhabdoformis]WSE34682.1 FAD-dependent oxidoreductase [Amycolatopsis rhabdoformis]